MDATQTRDYIRKVLSSHTAAPNVVLSHADVDHYGHIANTLNGMTVASVWQGSDVNEYTSNGFPAWLSDQMTRGATLHRNFSPHFHNDGATISDQLSCGDASTFVLTVNTVAAGTRRALF